MRSAQRAASSPAGASGCASNRESPHPASEVTNPLSARSRRDAQRRRQRAPASPRMRSIRRQRSNRESPHPASGGTKPLSARSRSDAQRRRRRAPAVALATARARTPPVRSPIPSPREAGRGRGPARSAGRVRCVRRNAQRCRRRAPASPRRRSIRRQRSKLRESAPRQRGTNPLSASLTTLDLLLSTGRGEVGRGGGASEIGNCHP